MRKYTVGMAALVLVVLLGSAGESGGQGQTVNDKDKAKLQGTWIVQTLEIPGKKFAGDDLKKMKMDKKIVFSGDKTYPLGEQDKDEANFVLDASKTPRHIDLTDTKGKNAGKRTMAIYTFEGNDTLKMAISMVKNGGRPTEFTSDEKTQVAVMILKREKK